MFDAGNSACERWIVTGRAAEHSKSVTLDVAP
jgi:hypothetical protein